MALFTFVREVETAKRLRKGFIVVAAACLAIVVIVAMAIPNLPRWRMAASEISAPHDLQMVDAAIKAYASKHGTPRWT